MRESVPIHAPRAAWACPTGLSLPQTRMREAAPEEHGGAVEPGAGAPNPHTTHKVLTPEAPGHMLGRAGVGAAMFQPQPPESTSDHCTGPRGTVTPRSKSLLNLTHKAFLFLERYQKKNMEPTEGISAQMTRFWAWDSTDLSHPGGACPVRLGPMRDTG